MLPNDDDDDLNHPPELAPRQTPPPPTALASPSLFTSIDDVEDTSESASSYSPRPEELQYDTAMGSRESAHNPADHPSADEDPADHLDVDMSDDGGASLTNFLDAADLATPVYSMEHDPALHGDFDDGASDFDLHNHTGAGFSEPDDDPFPSFPIAPNAMGFLGAQLPLAIPPPFYQPVNANYVSEELVHIQEHINGAIEMDEDTGPHGPVSLSNPNPNTLGPDNHTLYDFLRSWAWQSRGFQSALRERGRFPWCKQVHSQAAKVLPCTVYDRLEGDQCDFQGLDWEDMGVTRSEARERRLLTYKNYANHPGSDKWHPSLPDEMLPQSESFFRFKRMDIRRNVHLAHFQLRNIMACTSRGQAFYAGSSVVHEINPATGEGKKGMTFGYDASNIQISTIAARHGILVAGGFNGEYCIRNLDSEDTEASMIEGTFADVSGITNHIQVHTARRSSAPQAAFASNDQVFRVWDIETNQFVSESRFDYAINCSALSPDKRLRVLVGDQTNVLIMSAENGCDGRSPELLQALPGHRDFGFACDWSDDGWTVATGFQDKAVKIWDARRWTDSSGHATPVCTIRSEMAGVRSLRFSPVGSGKRVLVAAEEADFINVIDAQTFRSKQTFDMFGEIAGIDFAGDGDDLLALCSDRVRGGLLQFERCRLGNEAPEEEPTPPTAWTRQRERRGRDRPQKMPTSGKNETFRRRRQAVSLTDIQPF